RPRPPPGHSGVFAPFNRHLRLRDDEILTLSARPTARNAAMTGFSAPARFLLKQAVAIRGRRTTMQESSSHGREKLELARAFRAFTELSWQLEGSYRSLQNQVAELGRQLESARAERRAKAKQAKQLARRLELLLATLPAGVVVLDEAGSVLT